MSWRVFKGSIALGLSFAVATSLTLFATESTSYATPTIARAEGTVDGAPYEVQVPPNFNGTLLLYSHGYVFDGANNPTPIDASDPISQGILLSQGYALAGSSYSQQGWAVKAALTDQIATLNLAKAYVSSHSTTPISSVIPWGVSMGGDVTAGLVQQNIGTFSGSMIACGVDGGAVPIWNQQLTALFAFKELIDPSLQIADLSSPATAETQLVTALEALNTAATTPAGRARLSLVAALGDIPGWFWNGSITSQPNDTAAGIATQLTDQIEWLATTDLPFSFLGREDLEAKAGGNPSWTTGVQYASVLKKSIDAGEVQALYSAIPSSAGVSLAGDLATLQDATQISADPAAVTYLQNAIDINGETGDIPILTMHTIGDGLVSPQNETAYKDAVDAAGNGNNLAQVYVNNAGHCEFNPAELVAGIDTVHARIVEGSWNPTPTSLNTLANAIIAEVPDAADVSITTYDLTDPLGDTSTLEPHAPDFVSYHPGAPLRPYQQGYTTTTSRGQLSYHAAPPRGSLAPGTSTAPIIGIAATPAGNGYWLVNAHGQVFTRGSAKFYGQVAATMPNPGHPGSPLMPGAPMPPASIVGIAATPGGHGYWLVSSTGKVYNFGSAKFYGQVAATMPNPGHPGSPLMPGAPMPPASIVGIAATPGGHGYWLVSSTGKVYNFGSAKFYGQVAATMPNPGHPGSPLMPGAPMPPASIVGIAATPYGAGYWVFGANGAVYSFGGAPTYPAMATSPGPSTTPVTAATIG